MGKTTDVYERISQRSDSRQGFWLLAFGPVSLLAADEVKVVQEIFDLRPSAYRAPLFWGSMPRRPAEQIARTRMPRAGRALVAGLSCQYAAKSVTIPSQGARAGFQMRRRRHLVLDLGESLSMRRIVCHMREIRLVCAVNIVHCQATDARQLDLRVPCGTEPEVPYSLRTVFGRQCSGRIRSTDWSRKHPGHRRRCSPRCGSGTQTSARHTDHLYTCQYKQNNNEQQHIPTR